MKQHSVLNELCELTKAGIISEKTAEEIQRYYKTNKTETSGSRLPIIFGVLGSLLVALGIVLIIYHNWYELGKGFQTALALLPMLAGQALVAYTLIKRNESKLWRESTSSFLFISIGACIALISDIHHISDDLSTLLLSWMLLSIPIVYLMRSSMTSIFYIAGATYFAAETAYFSNSDLSYYYYWLLLALALPHYYKLIQKETDKNYTAFHNWIIPISITIALGMFIDYWSIIIFIGYFSMFGLFCLIGDSALMSSDSIKKNGYKSIGSLGTVFLLVLLSYDWFWEELHHEHLPLKEILVSSEFFISALLSAFAGIMLYRYLRQKSVKEINPQNIIFILFIMSFIIGVFSLFALVLINLFILGLGIYFIVEGNQKEHFGIMNYGLLIITTLIFARLFDVNIDYIARGIIFVLVGAGFFFANYRMFKKRSRKEHLDPNL